MTVAAHPRVRIGGRDVVPETVRSVIIDQETGQPDVCQVTLANVGSPLPSMTTTIGDALEVGASFGTSPVALFEGEVASVEAQYDLSGASRCTVIAYNRLHRLTRGRKSRTFENMSDQDIAAKIAREHNLTAKVSSSPRIIYTHVYQHNQTDLEFLQQRATRIGHEVVVTGAKTLEFRLRDPNAGAVLKLKLGHPDAGPSLQRYTARLSNANQVSEVQVRGWDPHKRKEIVGKAKAVFKGAAAESAKTFGQTVQFEVDDKVQDLEQANARASSLLEHLLMHHIVGDARALGQPEIKPGVVIDIDLGADKRFSGPHFVVAVSQCFYPKAAESPRGGYYTTFRFQRLPEATLSKPPEAPPKPPAGGGGGGAGEALGETPPATPAQPKQHFVDITLKDALGKVKAGVFYELVLPDGSLRSGRTGDDGRIHITGLTMSGQCKLLLPDYDVGAKSG